MTEDAPSELSPVRVVIVDDQHLVRQGIQALLALSPHVTVIAEADDGHAGLAAIEEHHPDVVLLDLRMPRMSGLEMLRVAGMRGIDLPPVLVLTTFDDDDAIFEALRLGARGYLLKDVTLKQLVESIETLASGGRVIQPGLTAGMLERLVTGGTNPTPGGPGAGDVDVQPLSEREVEVMRLLAAGYSNREVAKALHLAEGTVKNHVSAILLKLGVRDRTRAVLRAIELGLIAR
ncbi:MAG: response regulator transcription factor [Actinomycetales bacterium]|jgi:DNA-binding NarL/FixJ family response regulator|nr:response regulator transcription factor [Actinomycetales bacterium]HMT33401.1 response regulator transcription factor [Dermatophilaceae bacterium]